jgi:small-conductance mechanosensitive channel
MNYKNFHTDSFSEDASDARGRIRRYQARQDKHRRNRKKEDDFLSQDIDVKDYIISPEGYESIMLAIYFLTVPYIIGLSVIFFYVADADFEKFQMIDFTTVFVVWMIGYEVIAALLLFFIFIAFIRSFGRSAGKV